MANSLPIVVLGIYFFIMLIYTLGAFLILYHLIRFGVGTQPKRFALIFLCGSIMLFFLASLGLAFAYPVIRAYAKQLDSARPTLNTIITTP